MTEQLKPCPFCGGGTHEIRPNGRMWLGMKYSEPASVSVLHWCDAVAGQPSRVIERVGRDEAAAIEAWNRRAQPAQAGQLPITPETGNTPDQGASAITSESGKAVQVPMADDTALIRQLDSALARCRFDSLNMSIADMKALSAARAAASKRLGIVGEKGGA